MANILTGKQSNAIEGPGVWVFTAPEAGAYFCRVDSFVTPTSGLSIVITQNSTTLATSIAPTANQQFIYVEAKCYAAVNDTITVTMTSSAVQDSIFNNVKSIISVGRI